MQSQTRPATANRRTMIGPLLTCMNMMPTAATIMTGAIKISGRTEGFRGQEAGAKLGRQEDQQ